MVTDEQNAEPQGRSTEREPERTSNPHSRIPGVGDDEREIREHIVDTGEPKRDKFGNADGAS